MNLIIKLIKNSFFILCYSILFKKILNIKKIDSKLYTFLFCLTGAFIYLLIDSSLPYMSYAVLILGFSLFQSYLQKISFETSFIASLISYAITYVIFSISALIVSITVVFITQKEMFLTPESLVIYHSILAVLEVFFTLRLCKVKRLKNGLPFIRNQKYTFLGVCISLCILVLSSILNNGKDDIYYFVLFLLLYIFMVMLIIYSHTSTTNAYMDELTKRTINDLNHQLLTKNARYNELLADKEQLSEIVHWDNKLLPALESAVTTYLKGNINIEQGTALLTEIERLSKERKNTLELIEQKGNPLPSCNITAIDTLLSYMQQQAEKNEIQFDVNFHCDMHAMIENGINIDDLCTLLADLIENAIIATIHNKGNYIMLSFSLLKKTYAIQITDSGIPFSKEVLLSMGIKKITTHGDEKGSGIGMMKTFEILNQYQASMFINEYDSTDGLYSKTLSILCDNKKQFVLYTLRDELEIAQLYERPDLIVIHK